MTEAATAKEATRLVVLFLRFLNRWDQRQFAESSGVDQRDISRYETGERSPKPRTLARLAGGAGVSPALLGLLLEVFRQTCVEVLVRRGRPLTEEGELTGDSQENAATIARAIAKEVETTVRANLEFLLEKPLPPPLPEEARAEAAAAWQRFEGVSDEGDRRFLIREGEEFQSWAFCERLCAESVGQFEPEAARALADLAVYAAEQPCGELGPRRRLQGYAWGFVAAARHRLGDESGAATAASRARELWAAGQASPHEPLEEERWLAQSVSLRPN